MTPETPTDTTWLPEWLARLEIDGQPPVTRATLEDVTRAHLARIPFENLSVLGGDVPSLDLGSLTRKLIAQRRGGYCFELNLLLCTGLCALGFKARLLMARVMRNRPEPGPRTHCVVIVTIEGTEHLVDVGFGGPGPSAPLEMLRDTPLWADGVAFRLDDRTGLGTVLGRRSASGDWADLYAFTDEVTALSDLQAGNWLAATPPGSQFRQTLVVARQQDGRRYTLEGTTFREFHGTALVRETSLHDVIAVLTCLQDMFGLTADPTLTQAVVRSMAQGGAD